MYTLAGLCADLTARVKLTNPTADVQAWQYSAIREMIDSGDWRIIDIAFADLPVDGVRQRWMLPGDDIIILGPDRQLTPDGLASPPFYVPYASVAWRERAPDDVIVEQGVDAAGAVIISQTVGGITCGGGAVAATGPPAIPTGATAANTFVRLWYQRRCPQPDYASPTSPIRCDMQFARIATLGYYLGILSDNQAGGDLRQWRKKSDEYIQQASVIYQQGVPQVNRPSMKADGWLVGA